MILQMFVVIERLYYLFLSSFYYMFL